MAIEAVHIVSVHTDKNDDPKWEFKIGVDGVTRIKGWTENLGDHGLAWFDVHKGDRVAVTLAAREVAFIEWAAAEAA